MTVPKPAGPGISMTVILLDLMHLKNRTGSDISLFYRDISSIAEDEDLRVHFKELSKLDNLLRKVCAKETRKHALSRLKFKLNKDIVLTVDIKIWSKRLSNLLQSAFMGKQMN